ncbi:hypothetical protein BU26DRAFT_112763 [Trematosphaeria pertusa]|uniref:Uncharacterized protein n=1 Tax=Trematosphaeria pertusa TaxID=390896 RepID=A0A6A6HZ67_9PLEO|nr:uncharacterized protein BU26DRAFT_112763 [Trematosphaeria pertusa]KAF2243199.1 hypothetical protein BU26DRAFT_112763 [Trematosphaeria pertusa]
MPAHHQHAALLRLQGLQDRNYTLTSGTVFGALVGIFRRPLPSNSYSSGPNSSLWYRRVCPAVVLEYFFSTWSDLGDASIRDDERGVEGTCGEVAEDEGVAAMGGRGAAADGAGDYVGGGQDAEREQDEEGEETHCSFLRDGNVYITSPQLPPVSRVILPSW